MSDLNLKAIVNDIASAHNALAKATMSLYDAQYAHLRATADYNLKVAKAVALGEITGSSDNKINIAARDKFSVEYLARKGTEGNLILATRDLEMAKVEIARMRMLAALGAEALAFDIE